MLQRFYDHEKNRLIYIQEKAESDYWDTHWNTYSAKLALNPFVMNETKRYLPAGAKVLEGGCGLGDKVYSLLHAGYEAVGVDFAEKTVLLLNERYPDMSILKADIRKLPFEDASFDGYWSLGVIEHFYDGYSDILAEMHRVVRSGGYLFVTAPATSLLRRLKAKLGLYPSFNSSVDVQKFYQYTLPENEVIKSFEKNGFQLIKVKKLDGFKGLKDEVSVGKKLMSFLYKSRNPLARAIRKAITILSSRFNNHMSYYVFKKVA